MKSDFMSFLAGYIWGAILVISFVTKDWVFFTFSIAALVLAYAATRKP